ncbi:MAG: hypothetical protein HETSPECPRED_004111 [Heterodermia speciosa]|uniref:DASH complex subunit DUO1 n=1 Tax=Heterodermia speciosa TaxID=116794 RepID=A0A8H3IN44_9LECA|nr:MAG: hypothetical protein HETSPECPRED_004111 [Heterodermia speciosa]
MASNGVSSQMNDLHLSDSDTEDLFASPSRLDQKKAHRSKTSLSETLEPPPSSSRPNATPGQSKYDTEEAREAALRKELAGVRNINQVVEGVIESLEKAKGNMDSLSGTVSNACTLLQTWTRILSQTEHNQRLILNPSWQGATQDMADLENETLLKQQEKERRDIEEAQRREASARKAEEDERRRSEAATVRGARGTRGRARGSSRGASTDYVGVGGQGGVRGTARGGALPGRSTSGIGRGIGGRRRAT